MNKTIVFQVFDWEKLGKAECIGEVILSNNTIIQESPNNCLLYHMLMIHKRYKFLCGN